MPEPAPVMTATLPSRKPIETPSSSRAPGLVRPGVRVPHGPGPMRSGRVGSSMRNRRGTCGDCTGTSFLGEGITVSDLRMIDADGHVLEQLQLPPEVFGAFLARLSGGSPIDRGRPGADGGVACRAHVPAARRIAARPAPRRHGRRRHRHRGAVPDHARARVGARGRRDAHDGARVQPLAARVLLREPGAPHRRRSRRRCRTRRSRSRRWSAACRTSASRR